MSENENVNSAPTLQDYHHWLDSSWWSPDEACFVLLGFPPMDVEDTILRMQIMSSLEGKKIKDLIDRAVTNFQIEDLQREGGS